MKGQSELTSTFIKLVQIALMILGALAIFFTYVTYEITVYRNDVNREAYVLGNALLASPCLNNGIKGIILESKIAGLDYCFDYPTGEIDIITQSFSRTVVLGAEPLLGGENKAEFDIIVILEGTGQRVPGKMVVRL